MDMNVTPGQPMRNFCCQKAVCQCERTDPGSDDVIAYHLRQAFKPGK